MRLWWITATALFVTLCLIGQSESTQGNNNLEGKDLKNVQAISSEGKVLLKRKILRRKLEGGASSEAGNENTSVITISEKGSEDSSLEDTSIPKSTTFIQARRALFNRLNKPLLRNRALDTTISKLRSRLGALASSEKISTGKKTRLIKKIIRKPTTTVASEIEKKSPISIRVPTDQPHKSNDSMIMIPVPPSQRKPYQPVIMQVSKSEVSSTAAPETNVVTYKLNKMFVPIGIYGRVVGDAETGNNTSDQITSQDNKGPEIRHKGTQSESSEKFTGVKVSESSEDQQEKWDVKNKGKKLRKPKEHSRIADTIDITYDYKPKVDQVSLTNERNDPSLISLTSESPEMSVMTEDGNQNRRVWGSDDKKTNQGGLTRMSPPRPMNKDQTGSGSSTRPLAFLDTIKQTASNFPSFLHKGFTSLSSLTSSFNENPFHDDTFTSASEMHQTHYRNPSIVASIPGGHIPLKNRPTNGVNSQSQMDYESLEYFRNRPHLFGRQRKLKHPKSNSGFRPMSQEYYNSAPPAPNQIQQKDSTASNSHESIEKASPSSWRGIGDSIEPKMVPTEELNSSWKDYLFSSSEFGNAPGPSKSWRSFFGLVAPSIEGSSIMSQNFGSNPMSGGRRRSMMLDRQWKTITSKYSKNEIDVAKTQIHKYFSGPEPRSFDEHPSHGGAFNDLLKMFKLWFNVGHGRSFGPMKSFEHIKSESQHSSEDSWKPVSEGRVKNGGHPLISFSAGISFPTKNPIGGQKYGSHYSASPKPFIPHKYGNGLSNHITTLAHNYVDPTSSTLYTDDSPFTSLSEDGEEYEQSGADGEGGEIGSDDTYSVTGSESSSVVTNSKSHYNKGSLNDATLNADPLQGSESTSYQATHGSSIFSGVGGEDSPYELVPSDVYFRDNKNPDMREIAGVVKPAGVSDEVVRAHLPQVAGVPTFSYPSHYAKNPQGLNSLNQIQQYLTTADGKPMETNLSYKQRVEQYKKKEQSFMLPQHFYDTQYSSIKNSKPVTHQTQQSSSSLSTQALNAIQHQQLQSLYPKQQPFAQINQAQQPFIHYNQGQQGQMRLKTTGDSSLGFSDFQLPENLDPDIASLLKTELDKDDVPEDIRKDFVEAKRQEAEEKSRKQQQVRQQGTRLSPTTTFHHQRIQNNRRQDLNSQQKQLSFDQQTRQFNKRPTSYPLFHFNQNQRTNSPTPSLNFLNRNQHRQQSQNVIQKFFAPMPISPSVMSQTMKGRYQSPVPRYVVELAKKLQRDKDVQGIVRVSTKRGNGPPIEFLYPVRG